ncbi:MAG: glycosyltransferase [Weeksellaceae bacterium]|nr:glycosyltransferase [Weeksellaceae bacterium]
MKLVLLCLLLFYEKSVSNQMPKIITSVINNYNGDQRVQRVCQSLHKFGFEVEVIATNLRNSDLKTNFPYPVHRIHLKKQEGVLFYVEFNWKLFRKLLKITKKGDILLANDLDALLPNYWVSKLRGNPLVFDSHEIFSELPSLTHRKVKKKIWKSLEASLVPKMKYFYTVSKGCADWFEEAYQNRPKIIQNVPMTHPKIDEKLIIELPNLNSGEKIMIYQGTINICRGIDKMIQAMQFVENAQLWIVGNGPEKQKLEQLAMDLNVEERVHFFGTIPPAQLKLLTPKADLGLSLEEDGGLSYRYASPNKVFDYIHAGIPVLGTYLPEIKYIIETYGIGMVLKNHEIQHIAEKMKLLLGKNKSEYAENLKKAAQVYNWEIEEKKLEQIFQPFLQIK